MKIHKDDTETDIIIELQIALDTCRDRIQELENENYILAKVQQRWAAIGEQNRLLRAENKKLLENKNE